MIKTGDETPLKRDVALETPTGSLRSFGSDAVDLDYGRPADEQIAAAVKAAILSMQLPPGQLISEKEVGRMFGASRTPVRAAFAQLREEGLLVTWPSRGTFVTNLSLKEIRSAQFLREGIETTVVKHLCAEGILEQHRAALEQNMVDQKSAAEGGDYASFHLLDDQFHSLLVQATGFARVDAALGREKAVLDRLRSLELATEGAMERLRSDHAMILKAVNAGDTAAAVEALQAHARLALGTLSGLIEKHRGYFDLDETSEDI